MRNAGGLLLLTFSLGVLVAPTQARYARRTPIVEAVNKTRLSIVTIKVLKHGAWGRNEIVGTGVIIDERGYVVTNCHVVSGADRVAVHLADGGCVTAEIHTEDREHDLAILRLPGKYPLQALAFAPASDLMIGETVIAVGHPFGYTNTVSTGIVSALNREVSMPGGVMLKGLIQTNASINPGNSGGPLLNINGELIGINVALREGAQGIAFALSADMVQRVLAKHLSAGRVARLAHGLACHEEVAGDGQDRQRVVVDRVADKSPAAEAGLKHGDVLVRLADRAVSNRFDVERALWTCRAGEKIEAEVVRGGKSERLALTLMRGDEPERTAVAAPPTQTRPRTGYSVTRLVRNRR